MDIHITSAVPDADVIALEDVFGIFNPAAEQIDTIIGVVLFPASPPMLCLSKILPFKFRSFPVLTIAFVR